MLGVFEQTNTTSTMLLYYWRSLAATALLILLSFYVVLSTGLDIVWAPAPSSIVQITGTPHLGQRTGGVVVRTIDGADRLLECPVSRAPRGNYRAYDLKCVKALGSLADEVAQFGAVQVGRNWVLVEVRQGSRRAYAPEDTVGLRDAKIRQLCSVFAVVVAAIVGGLFLQHCLARLDAEKPGSL